MVDSASRRSVWLGESPLPDCDGGPCVLELHLGSLGDLGKS